MEKNLSETIQFQHCYTENIAKCRVTMTLPWLTNVRYFD